jgi:hypothetical protein
MNQAKLVALSAAILVLLLIEVGAFLMGRPLGDYSFLFASIGFCCLSVWFGLSFTSWFKSLLASLTSTLVLLLSNAYFANWVRNEWLQLGEDFGESALRGIVVYGVILPLTSLALTSTAICRVMMRRRME